MRKNLFLAVLFLCVSYFGFAQQEEKLPPKGQLLAMPVTSPIGGYQTEQVLLDVSSVSQQAKWKKINWKEANGVCVSQPFANPGRIAMESPSIQLPVLQGLDKRINLYMEEAFELESYYDKGLVQVSTDEGKTWTTLSVSTGKSDWRTSVVNLTSYAGKRIKLAFNVVRDGANEFKGWSIRKIRLTQDLVQAPENSVVTASTLRSGRTMGVLNGQLTGIDAQKFPRYVYAQVKINDGTTPLASLREPNFYIREYVRDLLGNGSTTLDTLSAIRDSSFKVYPPNGTIVKKPVDIVFLMDNSGSMADEKAQIYTNVTNFVNQLASQNFDFQLALCRFGQGASNGIPLFHNNAGWYSNATDFTNMWNSVNTIGGGYEPSWDALYESTTQYSFRPGAQKVFILITDESITNNNINYNKIKDRQIVINKLLDAGVKTYAIVTTGVPFDYDFGGIASATGGRSYDINAPFTGILNDIGTEINNTYTIRYTPTNPVFDGLKRDVEIKASHNGSTITLLGQYTPGAAPILIRTNATLALHTQSQPEKTAVAISVESIDYDNTPTTSVTLYYRAIAQPGTLQGPYKQVTMSKQSTIPGLPTRAIWLASIPSGDVLNPGVQYYFRATDSVATTTNPEFLDRPGFPYSFAVLPNIAPVITHTPLALVSDVKLPITFQADVTDNTNTVSKVYLYYQTEDDLTWTSVEMTLTTAPTYQYVLPALNKNTVLYYYIVAIDNFGVSTFHGQPTTPHTVGVGTVWPPPPSNHFSHLIRFTTTGSLASTVTIGNTPPADGDIIGVFFNDNGQLRLGGSGTWRNGAGLNISVRQDDPATPTKDGFITGEAFIFKIFRKADGKIFDCVHTIHTTPFSVPTFQAGKATYIKTLRAYEKQTMTLKKGLNLWSANVIPTSLAFADIFNPIASSVESVMDSYGNIFIPGASNNTLTTYVSGYGYQVLMKATATLTMFGMPTVPTTQTIQLKEEGTIVGCPYVSNQNVEKVFPRNTANIYIVDKYVTDETTQTLTVESYSPAWDLNDWTTKNMEPGQGYYVYVFNSQPFTFPAATGSYPARLKSSQNIAQKITSSDEYMHVYVPASAWPTLPEANDELRAYSKENVLLGRNFVKEDGSLMTLDGVKLTNGEQVSIRYWHASTSTEENLSVTAWQMGNGSYQTHTLAVVGSFQTTRNLSLPAGVHLFPNPVVKEAKVVFDVKNSGPVSVQLLNAQGSVVKQLIEKKSYGQGRQELVFNTQALPKGVYVVQITTNGFSEAKQLVVTH